MGILGNALANMVTKSQGYETLKTDKTNLYELIKNVVYDCRDDNDHKLLKKTIQASAMAQVKRYDSSSGNWSLTFDNPGLGRTSALVPEIRVFDHYNMKIYVYKGVLKSLREDVAAIINDRLKNGITATPKPNESIDETKADSSVVIDDPSDKGRIFADKIICPICGLETTAKAGKCDFCGGELLHDKHFSTQENVVDVQEVHNEIFSEEEIPKEEEKIIVENAISDENDVNRRENTTALNKENRKRKDINASKNEIVYDHFDSAISPNDSANEKTKKKGSTGVLSLVFGIVGLCTCMVGGAAFAIAGLIIGIVNIKKKPEDIKLKVGIILSAITIALGTVITIVLFTLMGRTISDSLDNVQTKQTEQIISMFSGKTYYSPDTATLLVIKEDSVELGVSIGNKDSLYAVEQYSLEKGVLTLHPGSSIPETKLLYDSVKDCFTDMDTGDVLFNRESIPVSHAIGDISKIKSFMGRTYHSSEPEIIDDMLVFKDDTLYYGVSNAYSGDPTLIEVSSYSFEKDELIYSTITFGITETREFIYNKESDYFTDKRAGIDYLNADVTYLDENYAQMEEQNEDSDNPIDVMIAFGYTIGQYDSYYFICDLLNAIDQNTECHSMADIREYLIDRGYYTKSDLDRLNDEIVCHNFMWLYRSDSIPKFIPQWFDSEWHLTGGVPIYFVEVTAPDGYVNMREGSGTQYDIITPIYNGSFLRVYEETDDRKWLLVTMEDFEGWVASSQVTRL